MPILFLFNFHDFINWVILQAFDSNSVHSTLILLEIIFETTSVIPKLLLKFSEFYVFWLHF